MKKSMIVSEMKVKQTAQLVLCIVLIYTVIDWEIVYILRNK